MSASSPSVPSTRPVLVDLLPGALVRDVVVVGLYVLAIAAAAELRFPIPGSPVMVTAQTFVVLLGAAALGTTRASVGAALFLGAGVAGVPWLAHSGWYTVGYLVGFVVAAGIVGAVARRRGLGTFPRALAAMAVANVAILALGAVGLQIVLGYGPREAMVAGMLPFLVGDAVKLVAAAALLPATQRLLDR